MVAKDGKGCEGVGRGGKARAEPPIQVQAAAQVHPSRIYIRLLPGKRACSEFGRARFVEEKANMESSQSIAVGRCPVAAAPCQGDVPRGGKNCEAQDGCPESGRGEAVQGRFFLFFFFSRLTLPFGRQIQERLSGEAFRLHTERVWSSVAGAQWHPLNPFQKDPAPPRVVRALASSSRGEPPRRRRRLSWTLQRRS